MGQFSSYRTALDALDSAIKMDPKFAPALAFKASIHGMVAFAPRLSGKDFDVALQNRSLRLAKNYAERALAIDEAQARAYLAMNNIHLFNRDSTSARRGVNRAYELSPNDYIVVGTAGLVAADRGNLARSIELLRRAVELNPSDVAYLWHTGEVMYEHQQWNIAAEQAKTVISIMPDAAFGYALLAKASAQFSDRKVVIENAALAMARNPSIYDVADVALAYGLIGADEQAKELFESARAGDDNLVADPMWHFWMHMAIKDYDSSLGYLRRVIDEKFPFSAVLRLVGDKSKHPDFDPIRSDSVFGELVQRANTPLGADEAL